MPVASSLLLICPPGFRNEATQSVINWTLAALDALAAEAREVSERAHTRVRLTASSR